MATSSFDRKIEISNTTSAQKLLDAMSAKSPKVPISKHPYSDDERKRGEELLKNWSSRSNR